MCNIIDQIQISLSILIDQVLSFSSFNQQLSLLRLIKQHIGGW